MIKIEFQFETMREFKEFADKIALSELDLKDLEITELSQSATISKPVKPKKSEVKATPAEGQGDPATIGKSAEEKLVALREKFAILSKAGRKAEVSTILNEYGAESGTTLDPIHYDAVMEKVLKLLQ